jgi:hypothetical protein
VYVIALTSFLDLLLPPTIVRTSWNLSLGGKMIYGRHGISTQTSSLVSVLYILATPMADFSSDHEEVDEDQDEDEEERGQSGPLPKGSHPLLTQNEIGDPLLPSEGNLALSAKKAVVRAYVTAAYCK